MNIDFAQIIEKANARKDALEIFAARMKEAPDQVRKLHEVLGFFTKLHADVKFLDPEALAMVRREVDVAHGFTTILSNAASSLNYHDGSGSSRWGRFVDMLEGQA